MVQIRCLAEQGCPAWNGALTIKNVEDLERLQKVALRIILGSSYPGYKKALELLDLPTLKERRLHLCINFARKTSKNPKYSAWFTKTTSNTRTSKPYIEHYARTEIYRKSPIFYLTELLNNN